MKGVAGRAEVDAHAGAAKPLGTITDDLSRTSRFRVLNFSVRPYSCAAIKFVSKLPGSGSREGEP